MTPIQLVLDALQAQGLRPRRTKTGWIACCPVHENDGGKHKPSLVISEGDTQPVVLDCKAGCVSASVVSALHLQWKDICAENGNGTTTRRAPRRDVDETPPYVPPPEAEDQVAAWQAALFEEPAKLDWLITSKHLAKGVILEAQLGWDQERQGYTIPVRGPFGALLFVKHYFPGQDKKFDAPSGTRACLYGEEQLPKLPDYSLVLLTEGEIDSLACRSLGYVAVSGTGGASTWREEWAKTLARFETVVMGDHDPAGNGYAEKAQTGIQAAAGYVQRLTWPDTTPAKGDPADFLTTHTPEAFQALISATHALGKFQAIDLTTIMQDVLEPIPWAISGWLAKRDILLIGGEPGTGKSILSMEVALSLARGEAVMDSLQVDDPQRVLYIDEENNKRLAKRRLRMLLGGAGVTEPALLPLRYLTENSINLDNEGMAKMLQREIRAFRPNWIVLDSLIRFHQRDENSNTEMARLFSEVLRPLMLAHDCGIILLHHLAKPSKERTDIGHRLRGAGDIRAMVDQIWALEGDSSTNERTLKHEKNRWSETQLQLNLKYVESDDKTEATLRCTEEQKDAEDIILTMVSDATTVGCLRVEVIDALERRGMKAASRLASKWLGKLHAVHTLKRAMEGKSARYWHRRFAPSEAR